MPTFLQFFFRLSSRNWSFALLNYTGLILGFVVSIILFSFLGMEFSYDKFHSHENSIYRILRGVGEGNQQYYSGKDLVSVLPGPLGPEAKLQTESIEGFFRLSSYSTYTQSSGNETLELVALVTDPEFFEILTWKWLRGKAKNFQKDSKAIVLTRSFAIKLFGSIDVLGKSMPLRSWIDHGELVVMGVIEDFPVNSHIKGDVVVPIEPFVAQFQPGDLTNWQNSNYFTYLKIREDASIQQLEKLLDKIYYFNRPEQGKSDLHHVLQPLSDIHFNENVANGMEASANVTKHYVILAIAIIILLLACANYINMTVAQSINRAREIGIRKVSGAQTRNIFLQFFGETAIFCLLSFLLAFSLSWLMLPYFNYLLGVSLSLAVLIQTLPFLFSVLFITIIMAGSYPALILARYQPSKVLKLKSVKPEGGTFSLRDSLVVLQFTVSAILIIVVTILQSQLDYLLKKDPGFNREQILTVQMSDPEWRKKVELIRAKIKQQSNVTTVSFSSGLPNNVRTQQGREWTTPDGKLTVSFYTIYADEEYIDLYKLQVLEGRNLVNASKGVQEFLINETAVKTYGWMDPAGMQFMQGNDTIRIVGVLKDFHLQSKHQPINPLRIGNLKDGWITHMSIGFQGGDPQKLIRDVESSLKEISDRYPVKYSFFDEQYARLYESDRKSGEAIKFFTFISVIIAAMGLYGLILFAFNTRTKEIGIRKVLGASWNSISWLFSKHFAKLVGIGFALSVYPAYYLSSQWLSRFAYHVEISILHFVFALALLIVAVAATMAGKLISASKINPAEVLRGE